MYKIKNINKQGFTLIELLTVIAIIGILVGVITVSSTKARIQARDAQRKTDLNAISTALEMYYAQHKKYPGTPGVWQWDSVKAELQPYISNWPYDPKIGKGGSLNWSQKDQPYLYCCAGISSVCTKYFLDASLEAKEDADITIANTSCSANAGNYQTGVYQSGGNSHYRVTSK